VRPEQRSEEEEEYDRLGDGALAVIEASRLSPQTFD